MKINKLILLAISSLSLLVSCGGSTTSETSSLTTDSSATVSETTSKTIETISRKVILGFGNGEFVNNEYSDVEIERQSKTRTRNNLVICGKNVKSLSLANTKAYGTLKKDSGVLFNKTALNYISSIEIYHDAVKEDTKITASLGKSLNNYSNEATITTLKGSSSSIIENLVDTLSTDYGFFKISSPSEDINISQIVISYNDPETTKQAITSLSLTSSESSCNIGNTVDISKLKVTATLEDKTQTPVTFDATGESGYKLYIIDIDGYIHDYSYVCAVTTYPTVNLFVVFSSVESPYLMYDVVTEGEIPAKSLSFDITSCDLYEGRSLIFSQTITPSQTTNQKITYESTDSTVAKVDESSSSIIALKAGSTTITGKTANGKSASILVKVSKEEGFSARELKYGSYEAISGYAPSTGNQYIVVVPIHLGGTPTYQWNQTSFDKITKNCEEIQTYYKNASYGKLNSEVVICGTIDKIFSTKYTESALQDESNGFTVLYQIIADATEWVNTNYDGAKYDTDDDGCIDSIHFILDGNDKDIWGCPLWPHMGMTNASKGTIEKPTTLTYSSSNLRHQDDGFTTVHEQGHIYGLEDYYDYSSSDYVDFVGGADMQSNNVFDWNPLSKMSMRWASPYVLDDDATQATIKINSAAISGDYIIIDTNFNNTAFDEYIVLELFTKKGNNINDWSSWFKTSSGYGIRLYHVDARLYGYNSSKGFNSGAYVDDVTKSSYDSFQIAANNTTDNSYATPRPSITSINWHLIQLIQKGNVNTFGAAEGRQKLILSDLFVTADTFTIGQKTGYTNYGTNFFANKTKFNNGNAFPFGISFDEVSSTGATITIKRIG